MVDNKKIASFKSIFNNLDNDSDGKISTRSISLTGVDHNVISILSPMLSEMEEANYELTESDFLELACRLYETLSLPEKDIILTYRNKNRKSSVTHEHSFTVSVVLILSLKLTRKLRLL
jgi:hypothetical protein